MWLICVARVDDYFWCGCTYMTSKWLKNIPQRFLPCWHFWPSVLLAGRMNRTRRVSLCLFFFLHGSFFQSETWIRVSSNRISTNISLWEVSVGCLSRNPNRESRRCSRVAQNVTIRIININYDYWSMSSLHQHLLFFMTLLSVSKYTMCLECRTDDEFTTSNEQLLDTINKKIFSLDSNEDLTPVNLIMYLNIRFKPWLFKIISSKKKIVQDNLSV